MGSIPIMPALEDDEIIFNLGIDVDQMIDSLPEGLDRKVLIIIKFHEGRENAIVKGDFLSDLARMGFPHTDERDFRLSINLLRKAGVPICSTGGQGGGYWLAKDQEEVEEWIKREPLARMKDLSDQVNAIRAAAEKRWGRYSPEKQIPMF